MFSLLTQKIKLDNVIRNKAYGNRIRLYPAYPEDNAYNFIYILYPEDNAYTLSINYTGLPLIRGTTLLRQHASKARKAQTQGTTNGNAGECKAISKISLLIVLYFIAGLIRDITYIYGGGAGGMICCSVRYQAELLGLWDPQNRDLRRKLPPETMFSVG